MIAKSSVVVGSFATILIIAYLWFSFPTDIAELQFVYRKTWLAIDLNFADTLKVEYFLGLDGIGLIFIALNALMVPCLILAISEPQGSQISRTTQILLTLQTCLNGAALSIDLVLICFFWNLAIIPAFFLISGDRQKPKTKQPTKFFLLNSLSAVLAITVVCTLVNEFHSQTGEWTTNLLKLYQIKLLHSEQAILFVMTITTISLRLAVWPFHFEPTSSEPSGQLKLLCSGFCFLGIFSALRIATPFYSSTAAEWQSVFYGICILGLFSTSAMIWIQKNMSHRFAYFVANQTCLLAIGCLATYTPISTKGNIAITGVVILMVSIPIAVLNAFILMRNQHQPDCNVHKSTHRTNLKRNGTLAKLAQAGILLSPGTGGFIGIVCVLISLFSHSIALGTIISLAMILSTFSFSRALIESNGQEMHQSIAKKDLALVIGLTTITWPIGIFPGFVVSKTVPSFDVHANNDGNAQSHSSNDAIQPYAFRLPIKGRE